jgi:hypothetical protein
VADRFSNEPEAARGDAGDTGNTGAPPSKSAFLAQLLPLERAER